MPATSESRIRTLGLRTDPAIEGGRAIVSAHEQFIAVRTPSNPGYYFGNCLIFDRAPTAGDGERWPELFGEVFASDAGVRHAAFAWSGAGGLQHIEGFIDRGYAVEDCAVLTATHVRERALWIAAR